MVPVTNTVTEEKVFLELRRKVRQSELLSVAVEKLLRSLHFTCRFSVVVQNGQVLKSGYEEGYFSQRGQTRLLEDTIPGGEA